MLALSRGFIEVAHLLINQLLAKAGTDLAEKDYGRTSLQLAVVAKVEVD